MDLLTLFDKSITMGKEILVEMRDGIVLHETIGSELCVAGTSFQYGSSVYHTHLTDNCPSATDMINELFSSYIFNTKEHGVITATRVFRYHADDNLLNDFKMVMRRALNESPELVEFRVEAAQNMVMMRDRFLKLNAPDVAETINQAINEFILQITYVDQKRYITDLREKISSINEDFLKSRSIDKYCCELKKNGINMNMTFK